jgi:hypothetical protein
MTTEDRATRLLQMVAALEESITRLERQTLGQTGDAIRRLRFMQGEILSAIQMLEGDFPGSG